MKKQRVHPEPPRLSTTWRVERPVVEKKVLKETVQRILEYPIVNVFSFILTCFTLFFGDFSMLFIPRSLDLMINLITGCIMAIFAIELVLMFIFRPYYRWRLEFYIDLFCLLTLFLDFTFVGQWLYSLAQVEIFTFSNERIDFVDRSTRHLSILNNIRVFRLLKVIHIKSRGTSTGDGAEYSILLPVRTGPHPFPRNGFKIDTLLTDQFTLRLVLLFSMISILSPYYDFYSVNVANVGSLNSLVWLHAQTLNTSSSLKDVCIAAASFAESTPNLFALEMCRNCINTSVVMDCLRDPAYEHLHPSFSASSFRDSKYVYANYRSRSYNEIKFTALMGATTMRNKSTRQRSIESLLITSIVIAIFCVGYFIFKHDAKNIILRPIDRMVQTVKKLADNPLSITFDTKTADKTGNESMKDMETDLLEKTITKIGLLLKIGFGEAGTNIISDILSSQTSIQSSISGTKMMGIFGFIKIRRFMEATECLQEDVMVFVNSIGSIVHRSVHSFGGSANKNIGDSFLVTWKFDSDVTEQLIINGVHGQRGAFKLGLTKDPSILLSDVNRVTDNALGSFMKIIVDIRNLVTKKTQQLYHFTHHPGLVELKWELNMMYGLHIGWAIEGAIGSLRKIDASYLSPHVNIAARLEQACHQYDVPILVSENVYKCLTKMVQTLMRKIDRITVKGSDRPLELFTLDIYHYTNIATQTRGSTNEIRSYASRNEDLIYNQLKALRNGVNPEFESRFREGLEQYFSGDWQSALETLKVAQNLRPADGPTATLLRVLDRNKNVAPEGWQGFRELTSKY